MTLANPLSPTKRFVPALLPWLLGLGFLLVYLLTLNHWVSYGGLIQVAKASGWTWQPEALQPVNWLLTTACHLVPPKLVPLTLNLFSAVCAALTLTLLARSVALLPRDRTEDQRQREKSPFSLLSVPLAWLPVLLATLLCGLQLTFWENATAPSHYQPPWQGGSEMLDLLLFAYVIRCLLEFRIDERESWLTRASLVYGVAMTNNWAMIGFFPLFLTSLVWLVGLKFFNVRFLSRMFLWGSAGLLLYFVLPLVQVLTMSSSFSFWQLLKTNLALQKSALFALPFSKTNLMYGFTGDQPLWVLGLPSLLPVLVMAIRWPSYFGDPSKLGVALTTLIFHIFHAFLLLICVWVALDPQVSPRHLAPGIPMLTLYYLGALSVGYYSGYFLLVFRNRPSSRTRPTPLLRLANTAATATVWLVLLTATSLLLYRNLPQIRVTNSSLLQQYATFQFRSLPPTNSLVLSDDPRGLFLIQAAATQAGSSKHYLFLETPSLPVPDYHHFLKKHYPHRWPSEPIPEGIKRIDDISLLQEVFRLGGSNQVFYLNPSFGYYFEAYYQEPHGLCYQLKRYPGNDLNAPLPGQDLVQENEAFWTGADTSVLRPLVAANSPAADTVLPGILAAALDWLSLRLHLAKPAYSNLALLGSWYSRALDFWAVQLQKAGQFNLAGQHFAKALELNPGNRAAEFNREANASLQSGRKLTVLDTQALEERLGKYRSLEPLLTENGPFDEPTLCFEQARAFAAGGNLRQAVQYFGRTRALAPDHLPSRLWLAQLYTTLRRPDEVLGITHEIQTNSALFAASRPMEKELLLVEASADLAKNDVPSANAAVRTALQAHPTDQGLLQAATQVYVNSRQFTNALATVERQLQLSPTNQSYLVNKGWLYLQLNAYTQALPPLTQALSLETDSGSELHNSALLDRAIAYSRSGQLDAAQRDYEEFQKAYPNSYEAFYGLGDIAYQKKDTNAAIRSYELYLTNSPPGNSETNFVLTRLKELKPRPR